VNFNINHGLITCRTQDHYWESSTPSSPSSCCYGNILLILHHKVLRIRFISSNELHTLTICGNSLSSLCVGTNRDACTLLAITKIMMSVIMNTSTMSIRCQSFENFISCRRYVHNVQHYYNSCEGQHSFLNAYNIFKCPSSQDQLTGTVAELQ